MSSVRTAQLAGVASVSPQEPGARGSGSRVGPVTAKGRMWVCSCERTISLQSVLLTGACGPLGRCTGSALLSRGFSVLATDAIPDHENLYKHFVEVDLRDETSVALLIEWSEALGPVDALVNNAALTNPIGRGASRSVSYESLRDFFLVNAAAPLMLALQLCGIAYRDVPLRIVNIGSVYGIVGPSPELYEGLDMGLRPEYVASKGALHSLTRFLATALGNRALVNTIAPGGVQRDQPPEFLARYRSMVPLARLAHEEDVATVVAWLLSPDNRYVTGQTICVDGGWTSR